MSWITFKGFAGAQKRIMRLHLTRTAGDIMHLSDACFVKNFRLSKEAFGYVLRILEKELPKGRKSFAISPKHQLAACLRFFAEGSYQHGASKDYNVCIAQPTFCKILARVLNILERILCPKWIQLNGSEEQKKVGKAHFYRKCKIPGVVMCVDGSHIAIKVPKENPHLYYNRKGFYSINAMIICDEKQWIRSIDARFPGSNHDSFIWNNSKARAYIAQEYEKGDRNTRLLADSGYPLEPWLLTPYRSVQLHSRESKFNEHHSKGRNVVERTIGVLKNRFRCLMSSRALHYEPRKASQIINVCCALHNICLFYKVNSEIDYVENIEERHSDNESEQIGSNEANITREEVMLSL